MKRLTTDQIRKIWIDFFQEKGHLFIAPKSLIPQDDPSLLWINSGVATLKDYFSGKKNPPSNRLVNSQKAIRTNDITNVGVTSRHHTFFEMLGNFSIGDYFKKEAIAFAYELLTKHYGIDNEKLYITIFEDDDETFNAWIKAGIIESHIIRNGRDRNFWDVGSGPCGPCTEIYYDRGEKYDPNKMGFKLFKDDIENDRYVEIWNIVFSQFNNDGKNHYSELVRKNIDTGAGLERLASISQDVPTDFDTDGFQTIITTINQFTKANYVIDNYFAKDQKQKTINQSYIIIADHLKACSFAIADGAIPSNNKRGFVLRKLIRRAMAFATKLGLDSSKFLFPTLKAIATTVKTFYPEIEKHLDEIYAVINKEVNSFNQALKNGISLFNEKVKDHYLDGYTIFKLVETYGFPLEIIEDLAAEQNIKLDLDNFNKHFEEHQRISKGKNQVKAMAMQHADLINFTANSIFDYDHYETNGKVIGLFNDQFEACNSLNAPGWVAFDQTVFYATKGGQEHDNGIITIDGNNYVVDDVMTGPNGQNLHHLSQVNNTIKLNDQAYLAIDKGRRVQLMKNHTCEHLLHHALNSLIDHSIKQEGASKTAEKLTFDFFYKDKLTDKQLNQIETYINEKIQAGIPVKTEMMTLQEAKNANAIGLFEDVYAKVKGKLRVVSVGDISKELCAGTHIDNTKNIECFKIIKYYSKGAGSWRIEAISGSSLVNQYLKQRNDTLMNEYQNLKTKVEEHHLTTNDFKWYETINNDNYEKALVDLGLNQTKLNDLIKKQNDQNNHLLVEDIKKQLNSDQYHLQKIELKDQERCNLIKVIDQILKTNLLDQKVLILLNVCHLKGVVEYLIITSPNNSELKELIKNINLFITKDLQGRGGGKPHFVQGSFKLEKLDDFNKSVENYKSIQLLK